MKGSGLLFFPGTVIRWLSQESGQAASYFSGALFLLFHAQRQHDLMWPPSPATHGWNTAKSSRCGRQSHAVRQTPMSVRFAQNVLLENSDSTRGAALRDVVSNVPRRAEGVFWLSTCTHKWSEHTVSVCADTDKQDIHTHSLLHTKGVG